MKLYNNFINELYNRGDMDIEYIDQRMDNLSEEKFMELYKKNCTQYVVGKEIYRGIDPLHINNISNYMLIDPKKVKRTSIERENIHTFLMSELPEWKDYPKRDHSVIGIPNINDIKMYGEAYVLIPYDNANIGICPNDNIWSSFPMNGTLSINSWSRLLENMGLIKYVDSYDLSRLKKHFINDEKFKIVVVDSNKYKFTISILEKNKENDLYVQIDKLYLPNYDIKSFIATMEGLWNIMIDYFSPKNFENKNYNDYIKTQSNFKAIWTDSKCLLIKNELYQKLKNEL